jgi:lipopolysaccharide transport system ATP-binding protein
MNPVVISVENVDKIYQLGAISSGTLFRDINRLYEKYFKSRDQYQRIDENDEGGAINYSLKKVSFEIQQGDVLGILGKNGAGKSTLLKILSRTTLPTSGRVRMKGRIASLLEVGTGFHPEMTGRENIYQNGVLLGMRRKEIDAHLDEIIDFSGVEKYIDTPVKRYSSGMYVRLAFAVAAHLNSDILIVDEVLAVGDFDFQKKCLSKMQGISQRDGKTVLFVSHHMSSIRKLCTKGLFLDKGEVVYNGNIDEAINLYDRQSKNELCASLENIIKSSPQKNEWVELISAKLINQEGILAERAEYDQIQILEVVYQIHQEKYSIHPNVHLKNENGSAIFAYGPDIQQSPKEIGVYKMTFKFPQNLLNVGRYLLSIAMTAYPGVEVLIHYEDALKFEILESDVDGRPYPYKGKMPGFLRINLETNVVKL